MKQFAAIHLLALVLAFVATACAHPNYQDSSNSALTTPDSKTTACLLRFQSNEMCGDFHWEVQPTESETGTFVVHFTSAATGQALEPAQSLKVILWMPSMGHGSSPVEITRVSPGVYRVARVFFSMPGTWQIRFQLKSGSQIVEEQIATVQF